MDFTAYTFCLYNFSALISRPGSLCKQIAYLLPRNKFHSTAVKHVKKRHTAIRNHANTKHCF